MDLNLSEEQTMLQTTVRRFVTDHVLPLEREYGDRPLPKEIKSRLQSQARELGLWAPAAPADLGGSELGYLTHGLILEEAGRSIVDGCQGVADLFGGNPPEPLLAAGSSLRDTVVKEIVAGSRTLAWQAPGRPPEASFMKESGGYVLYGKVPYVEQFDEADTLFFLANGGAGAAYFVIDVNSPGIRAGAPVEALRGAGSDRTTVYIERCQVSVDRMIGTAATGFELEARWQAAESLRAASRLIGLLERGARMARDYARQRVTFGRPLSDRQAIQWKLVDAEMDIYSSRWVVRNALASADSGSLTPEAAAKARLHVLNAAWRSIDEVLQVFGGIGFTQDMPIEAMWRHIRVQLDRFGSPDQARRTIAAALIDG